MKQIENWRNIFELKCHRAFRKIKIRNKKRVQQLSPKLSKLINTRNKQRSNSDISFNFDKNILSLYECDRCEKGLNKRFKREIEKQKNKERLGKCSK